MESAGLLAALDHEPQPDQTFCRAHLCPLHAHGDPAQLDYRAKGFGWKIRCGAPECKNKATWRHTFLCERMPSAVSEFYCDSHLPAHLRPS